MYSRVRRSTLHHVGTREEKNEAEGREGIIKLITEAKDYPEPKKNLIKGLRFRLWNPKGEGKNTTQGKNLTDRRKSYLQRKESGWQHTYLNNEMLEVMFSEL